MTSVHAPAADRRAPPVAGRPLARIVRLEPRLHAFVSVNAAEAVDRAIRAGHAVGPLHSIPIAIKDLVEIEGDVTMGGTPAWRNRIAPHTATLVRRLMAAGMINLGKTHSVEFAYGGWGTLGHADRRQALRLRRTAARLWGLTATRVAESSALVPSMTRSVRRHGGASSVVAAADFAGVSESETAYGRWHRASVARRRTGHVTAAGRRQLQAPMQNAFVRTMTPRSAPGVANCFPRQPTRPISAIIWMSCRRQS
jgi:hypothetical protein